MALFVSSAILVATGNTDIVSGKEPKWFLGVSALALWVPFIIGLYLVSQRFGSQRFSSDFYLKFRRVDLWGLPIGIAGQLVLVGLVTWPFRVLIPEKFAPELIEKRAQDLFNNATGPWLIVLILVVVIGAPFVEELVYRGFIQSGIKNRLGSKVAVVITAVWFAAVHLQLSSFPACSLLRSSSVFVFIELKELACRLLRTSRLMRLVCCLWPCSNQKQLFTTRVSTQ